MPTAQDIFALSAYSRVLGKTTKMAPGRAVVYPIPIDACGADGGRAEWRNETP